MTTSRKSAPTGVPSQLDQEIADLLVFSVWALREAANHAFEPLGMTTFHVAVLNFIAHDPLIRSGDLSQRLGIIPVRASTMLTQLEKRGLLQRSTPQADRRGRNVTLTEAGEAIRIEANRLWAAVTVSRYENISDDDKETLLRMLKIIHPKPGPT